MGAPSFETTVSRAFAGGVEADPGLDARWFRGRVDRRKQVHAAGSPLR